MIIPHEPEGESVYGCAVKNCSKSSKWIWGMIPLCHEHAIKFKAFKSPWESLPKVEWKHA